MTTMRAMVMERGQVTLSREALHHLGIKPGDEIELDLLRDGRAMLRAARPVGEPDDFIGCLAGRTSAVASPEELDAASVEGWAQGR